MVRTPGVSLCPSQYRNLCNDLPSPETVYAQLALPHKDRSPGFEALSAADVKISINLVQRVANFIRDTGAEGVVSIGCGSGVFEYLLSHYFPLPLAVHGVDVKAPDDLWPPAKWRIMYGALRSGDRSPAVVSASQALLFAWGTRSPWKDYLDNWKGRVLVIIGDLTCNPCPIVSTNPKKDELNHRAIIESKGFHLHEEFPTPDGQVTLLYLRKLS